jgi:hypothetical protein
LKDPYRKRERIRSFGPVPPRDVENFQYPVKDKRQHKEGLFGKDIKEFKKAAP